MENFDEKEETDKNSRIVKKINEEYSSRKIFFDKTNTISLILTLAILIIFYFVEPIKSHVFYFTFFIINIFVKNPAADNIDSIIWNGHVFIFGVITILIYILIRVIFYLIIKLIHKNN